MLGGWIVCETPRWKLEGKNLCTFVKNLWSRECKVVNYCAILVSQIIIRLKQTFFNKTLQTTSVRKLNSYTFSCQKDKFTTIFSISHLCGIRYNFQQMFFVGATLENCKKYYNSINISLSRYVFPFTSRQIFENIGNHGDWRGQLFALFGSPDFIKQTNREKQRPWHNWKSSISSEAMLDQEFSLDSGQKYNFSIRKSFRIVFVKTF